jgi:two-component system cell cycle sensor histidine kinase/response regulator CckA
MERPVTVLLVDDEAAIRLLLSQSLRHLGYRLLEAASGADALAIHSGSPEPIDVLVSDIMMPEMTGVELARKLSASNPKMKVLFMSGFYEAPSNVKAEWEFLQKPFSPRALCDRLERMCQLPPAPTGNAA